MSTLKSKRTLVTGVRTTMHGDHVVKDSRNDDEDTSSAYESGPAHAAKAYSPPRVGQRIASYPKSMFRVVEGRNLYHIHKLTGEDEATAEELVAEARSSKDYSPTLHALGKNQSADLEDDRQLARDRAIMNDSSLPMPDRLKALQRINHRAWERKR